MRDGERDISLPEVGTFSPEPNKSPTMLIPWEGKR